MIRAFAYLGAALLASVLTLALLTAVGAWSPGHQSAPVCLSYGAHGQVGDATKCWQLPTRPIRRNA